MSVIWTLMQVNKNGLLMPTKRISGKIFRITKHHRSKSLSLCLRKWFSWSHRLRIQVTSNSNSSNSIEVINCDKVDLDSLHRRRFRRLRNNLTMVERYSLLTRKFWGISNNRPYWSKNWNPLKLYMKKKVNNQFWVKKSRITLSLKYSLILRNLTLRLLSTISISIQFHKPPNTIPNHNYCSCSHKPLRLKCCTSNHSLNLWSQELKPHSMTILPRCRKTTKSSHFWKGWLGCV